MSREEARKKFIVYVKPIMERNGFPYENPEKPLIDKKYQDCIKEKLKAGQSLEEIEEARKAFIE